MTDIEIRNLTSTGAGKLAAIVGADEMQARLQARRALCGASVDTDRYAMFAEDGRYGVDLWLYGLSPAEETAVAVVRKELGW